MLYQKRTSGSVEDILRKLGEAAVSHGAEVVGTHDLKSTLACGGGECRVLEVCNTERTRRALGTNRLVATILPIRIAVFEEGGQIQVAFLKPTALADLWNHPEIEPIAQEAEDAIICMIETACR